MWLFGECSLVWHKHHCLVSMSMKEQKRTQFKIKEVGQSFVLLIKRTFVRNKEFQHSSWTMCVYRTTVLANESSLTWVVSIRSFWCRKCILGPMSDLCQYATLKMSFSVKYCVNIYVCLFCFSFFIVYHLITDGDWTCKIHINNIYKCILMWPL